MLGRDGCKWTETPLGPIRGTTGFGYFDNVVLLSAPIGVMLDRVRLRTNNPYGKQDVEIAQIKENVRRFEPRLRRIASHEIDTSLPIRDVLETILKLQ